MRNLITGVRARRVTSIAASFALAATVLTANPAADSPSIAGDTFDRQVTTGLGTTSTGAAYTSTPAGTASVDGQSAVLTLTPGKYTKHTLASVSALDASTSAKLSLDQLPASGNGLRVSLALRATPTHSYEAQVRFTKTGNVTLAISRHDGSETQVTTLKSDTPILTGLTAGQSVIAEFSVAGVDAVDLRARVYRAGGEAPKWQVVAKDTSAQRITAPGSPEIQTYLSSGSTASTTLRLDDYRTTQPDTTAPEPTPSPSEPTPTEPTPPTDPVPPVTPTEPASSAGALPVGQARYDVPANAIFATPGATPRGSGTQSDPYVGAQHAIDKASAGSTIVLRAGRYHETITVPSGKRLTVQAYPGEPVWFDGSEIVSGWTKTGSTWSVNWNHIFDNKVSFTVGKHEAWWVNAAYPAAGYPDQVWIDGVALTQVTSAAQVTTGTFFVDRAAKRLVLGSDPSGRTVEASTLQRGIQVFAEGTKLLGFGVRRYATNVAQLGTVGIRVKNATVENVAVVDNATIGLVVRNSGHLLQNVTVSNNGLQGIGGNQADNLTIRNASVTGNNAQHFNPEPVSAGSKISDSRNVRVESSLFADNHDGTGLWFDESSSDAVVVGNTFARNGKAGFEYEISKGAIVAGNYVVDNKWAGLYIFNSNEVSVWNNTFVGNARTLMFMQDGRRQVDPAEATTIPWIMSAITVRNNILSYGTGNCPILAQDQTQKWAGNQFGVTMDGNQHQRANAASPKNFACWAAGSGGTKGYRTIADYRAYSGDSGRSTFVEGAPVVDANWLPVPANAAGTPKPYALPAAIAKALGVDAGLAKLGPFTAPVK